MSGLLLCVQLSCLLPVVVLYLILPQMHIFLGTVSFLHYRILYTYLFWWLLLPSHIVLKCFVICMLWLWYVCWYELFSILLFHNFFSRTCLWDSSSWSLEKLNLPHWQAKAVKWDNLSLTVWLWKPECASIVVKHFPLASLGSISFTV